MLSIFIGSYERIEQFTRVGDFLTGKSSHAEIISSTETNRPTPRQDGSIDLKRPNNISFGFAITGTRGRDNLTINYKDLNFQTSNNDLGFTLESNDSSGRYKTTLINVNQHSKITNELENRLTDLSDFKFWYVYEVPEGIAVKYNNTYYYPNFEKRPIQFSNMSDIVNTRNQYQNIIIGTDTLFKFKDLLLNGFDITDVYMGNGSILNKGDKLIVAIGTTNENKTLYFNETLLLDPVLGDTNNYLPKASGNPYNDWANCDRITADDSSYTIGTTGQNCSGSNFSITQKDGGELPTNSYIQAIELQVDSHNPNTFSSCTADMIIGVKLSWNSGSSFTPEKQFTVPCASSGVYLVGSDIDNANYDLWGRNWKAEDFNNGTFSVTFRNIQDGNSLPHGIDYTALRIAWTNGEVNNITQSDLSFTLLDNKQNYVYHLAISNQTSLINKSNLIFYTPFEFNDTVVGGGDRFFTADFHLSDAEVSLQPSSSIRPTLRKGGAYGNYYYFNGSGYMQRDDGQTELIQNNFTVSLWINRTSLSGVAEKTLMQNLQGFVVVRPTSINGRTIRVDIENSTTTTSCTSGTILTTNGWNHVVFTYNGTTSIYADGALSQSCNVGGNIAGGDAQFYIGATSAGTEIWTGGLDEIMVIQDYLNSSQVNDLYNAQLRFLYPRGELEFPNLNIGTNNTINITALINVPNGTSFNISIGNKSGSTYIYNPEIFFNSTANNEIALLNDTSVSTPDNTNFSIKFIFYGNGYQSPNLNETFQIKSWQTTVADSCAYTSGNWNLDCSCNSTYTTNTNIDGNVSISGSGNLTFQSGGIWNFTIPNSYVWINKSQGNACYIYIESGGGWNK